jgi:hypothetical protein
MASSEDTDEKKADSDAEPSSGSSGLPAHLQLPNMDFSLPPLPGSEPSDTAVSHGGGDGGPPPPPRRKAKAAGAGPPPPPPRKGKQEALPDMSLPDFGAPQKKRKLTLISAAVPSEVLRDGNKKSVLPIVGGLVLLAAIGVGVAAREPLMAMLHPKPVEAPKPPPPSPTVEAKKAFAEGVRQYAAKDFPAAIEGFEHALQLDPKLADAHRSLGIVFATMHEQAKAVDHYRTYLELTPKAADATEVQKIVDDYAKAQAQPAAAAPAPEPAAEQPKPAKKAKAKKHGKH